jgi:sugar lactone lactonase YvrE
MARRAGVLWLILGACWLVAASAASAATPAFDQVSGSPFTTLGTNGIAFSPDGSRLVEADPVGDELVVYSVAADGSLSQVHTASADSRNPWSSIRRGRWSR